MTTQLTYPFNPRELTDVLGLTSEDLARYESLQVTLGLPKNHPPLAEVPNAVPVWVRPMLKPGMEPKGMEATGFPALLDRDRELEGYWSDHEILVHAFGCPQGEYRVNGEGETYCYDCMKRLNFIDDAGNTLDPEEVAKPLPPYHELRGCSECGKDKKSRLADFCDD